MTQPSPERWARIEEALDAALDRLNEDRATLLADLCGDDADLRREVSRLLASIDRSASSFERPPAAVVEAATVAAGREQLEPGKVVGAYRVIELLGRGGMGAVYLAERADGAFDRKVALKIVKRGMDSEEILRRFRRERQILARLEHPNIAGLLDGGITDDGVPYFVMELARGQPIDEWCDAQRLTIEQRIRLFIPVCDAVRHAHRSLIVHRDLKPSNILVVDGQPKLLDFGIAKVLSAEEGDESQATRVQERRLTPEYAAPEQVRGEPTTTATDVYALGVILYEMLTGRPPYRVQGGMAEVERVVCTVEPRAPSIIATRDAARGSAEDARTLAERRSTRPEALRTVLHGDLDAIVLKALAKEPERRYPSVNALIDDLRRHLDGHPVEARPASRWYHFRKFVRRNRTAVGLATAAALALIIGSGVALWQAGIAQLESRQRLAEAERAAAARDFVVRTLSAFDPDAGGENEITRDVLIQTGLENLAGLAHQPDLQAVVANTLGELFFNLGDATLADSLFRGALVQLEPLGNHPDLAISMIGIAEVARREVRFEDAEYWLRRALNVFRSVLPPDDPRIAETLAKLAFTLYNHGSENSRAEAERLYVEILNMRGSASVATRAAVLEGLGDINYARGTEATRTGENPDTSRAFFTRARDLYRESIDIRLAENAKARPDVARAMWGLALVLSELGDAAGAVEVNRRALDIFLAVYREEHRDVAFGWYYLGLAQQQNGEYATAFESFQRATAISQKIYGDSYIYTAHSLAREGESLARAGRNSEAMGRLEHALDIYRTLLQRNQSDQETLQSYIRTLLWAGEVLRDLDRFDEALRVVRESYGIALQSNDTRAARRSAAELARLFERTGHADSAAVYHARSLNVRDGL